MSALAKAENENLPGVSGEASDNNAASELQQYLTFTLGGEVFAIGILSIKEILEFQQLTEVPMTPDSVRGVINLRGSVVPVIDLSARFGGDCTEIARRTCIVILEVKTQEGIYVIGVIVDSVNEVLEIPPTEIEPTPSFGTRIRTDFISGMGKINGKFVILLDIGEVLSVNELTELETLSQHGVADAAIDHD